MHHDAVPSASRRSSSQDSPSARSRHVIWLCLGLAATNLAAWSWALAMFHDRPVLLGTALLAWGLGLRHALDADHIAAIDGATRKLVQEGQRPLSVGLFFALGHSTVVVLALGAVALAAGTAGALERIGAVGGVVGGIVSILFLFAVAAMNLVIGLGVWRTLRRVRAGRAWMSTELERLGAIGPLARLFRPLFRLVGRSWQMYPLGFLFGLGFDTAGAVAVLGVAAARAAEGLPIWSIMVLPVLFTAGMALVDTADGLLMVRACDWAFAEPGRRLRYNLAITVVSAVVAAAIGTVQALRMLEEELGVHTVFAAATGVLDEHSGLVGVSIVLVFLGLWLASMAMSRGRAAGARG